MSWRGIKGGIEAAKLGRPTVMTPIPYCYFDKKYRKVGTHSIYHWNPVPDELTKEEAKFVLGPQANFWSHIDRQEGRLFVMLFPRILAMSEVAWSPNEGKNWKEYQKREGKMIMRLLNMGCPVMGHRVIRRR